MSRRKAPIQRKRAISKQPRFDIPKTGTAMLNFYQSTLQWVTSLIEQEPEYDANSMGRDEWLSEIWKAEPYLAGVLNSVVSIDTNRGWSLEGGRNQVMRYGDIFHAWEVAPGIKGWRPGIQNASLSYYYTDLGGIVELGRDGDGGPLRGMYHVDSTRCYLNGSRDTPLTYSPAVTTAENNKEQDWKTSDFMRVASMISTKEKMNGLGFCAIGRCIQLAKIMVAVYEHDREQLGAKAPKGLLMLNGINETQWQDAMDARKGKLAAEQYDYFNAVAVLAAMGGEPISAQLVGLSTLPEGFDLQQFTSMLMYGYALCFNYDPREFWPVSGGQLGTATETEIQQEKATGKGGLNFIYAIQEQLQRGDVLPAALKFEFEQRDEASEVEEALAEKAWIDNFNSMRGSSDGTPEGAGITRDEYRMLLADHNIIPKEWTEVEEDIEVTDEEDDQTEDDLPVQPQPIDAVPLAPAPAPAPVAQMKAREKRILRDRLLSQSHIWRAIELFPTEDIVQLKWPENRLHMIWRRADTLLERYYFQGVTREGTENSGNYAHAGRPGEVGGSTTDSISVGTTQEEYNETSKNQMESLDDKHFAACRLYQRHGSVNAYLRGATRNMDKQTYNVANKNDEEYWKYFYENGDHPWEGDPNFFTKIEGDAELIKLLDESMGTLDQDSVLWRGALGIENREFAEGKFYTDPAFVSTTQDEEVTERFGTTLMEMNVLAGTPLIPIGASSAVFPAHDYTSAEYKETGELRLRENYNLSDREFLLGRNLVFKFTGEYQRGEYRILKFEVSTAEHYNVSNEDLKKVVPRYDPKQYQ